MRQNHIFNYIKYNPWVNLLTLLLILFTILRLMVISKFSLYFDEAHWWLRAKHLSFGYYEHPPLTAWVVWFFTSLGKDTEFFVRIGFVILFIFSTIMIYLLGKEVSGSKKIGFYSALLLNIIPLFSFEAATIVTPKSIQVFFYLATLFCFLKSIRSSRNYWWYLTGLSLGFGILTVHSMLLIIPIIFLFLLTSSYNRKWLYRKELYLSLFIAFVVASPTIVWDLLHKGGSFVFQLNKIFFIKSMYSNKLLLFIGSLLVMISPILFIVFLFAIVASGYFAVKEKDDSLWLLFLSSALILIILFMLSLLGMFVMFDYSGIGMLPSIVITAILFNKIYPRFKRHKHLLTATAVFACIVSATFTVLLTMNLISPLFSKVYFLEEAINGFYGYRELSDRIHKIKGSEPGGEKFFLFSDHYGISSELAFYMKDKSTYFIHPPDRHFSFDLWGYPSSDKNAIFITAHSPAAAGSMKYIKRFFKTIKEEGPLIIYKKNRPIRLFRIYRCYRD